MIMSAYLDYCLIVTHISDCIEGQHIREVKADEIVACNGVRTHCSHVLEM